MAWDKKEKMQSKEGDCRWHHIKGKSRRCQAFVHKKGEIKKACRMLTTGSLISSQ